MDWKSYEYKVHEILKSTYPLATITKDERVKGIYSKVFRQIDVLIQQYVAGNRIRIIVEAKYFNRKIDVKAVEACLGMLEDVQATKAIMVSLKGFSEAAYNRSHYGPSNIELEMLNFEELQRYQGECGMPYAGGHGMNIAAPFGWVVDARENDSFLCALYQRGLSLDRAREQGEFMYISFWDITLPDRNVESVLKIHSDNILEGDKNTVIEYIDTIARDDSKVVMCRAESHHFEYVEYTGFIIFEEFMFMCVLITPKNREKPNLRKLENVLTSAFYMKVRSDC